MNIKGLKKLSLMLTTTVLLQGCVAAAVVGGAAATKIATDSRAVDTQVDDATLDIRISSALSKDPQLKEEGRVVSVSYRGQALLIGQVPNANLKEVAASLTKGAEGVTEVYNQIRISQPISLLQQTKDSWITTKIKSELLLNSKVKTTAVKVATENSEVFLMGSLTQDQGNAAAEVARNVSGVQKVIKVFKYLD